MSDQPKEYSLAVLLDHPGLGLLITNDGIERRCLDLIFGLPTDNRLEEGSAGDKNTGYGV